MFGQSGREPTCVSEQLVRSMGGGKAWGETAAGRVRAGCLGGVCFLLLQAVMKMGFHFTVVEIT